LLIYHPFLCIFNSNLRDKGIRLGKVRGTWEELEANNCHLHFGFTIRWQREVSMLNEVECQH
jgi:hypothetical protein